MHPIFQKYIEAYPESEVAQNWKKNNNNLGTARTAEEFNDFAHRLWEGRIPEALELADPFERINLARLLFPEIVKTSGKVIVKEFRKTIYNPVTGRCYQIADRTEINAEAGQIRGLWSKDRDKKKCRHGRHGHRHETTEQCKKEILTSHAEEAREWDREFKNMLNSGTGLVLFLRQILESSSIPDEKIQDALNHLPPEMRKGIIEIIRNDHQCTCGGTCRSH